MIGDETGTIRASIWDENVINQATAVKAGDIIKINNAYSKQNNNFKELHLGSKSQIIINPENEVVSEIRTAQSLPRKQIIDLSENEFVEIFGTVVQVFEPRYYNSCPECSKKVVPEGEGFKCLEHGLVSPKQTPIVNIFFDDGSGNIRAVLFRDQALKLIGEKTNIEEIKKEVLGRQLLLKGKINKNEMFNRLELVVNNFEEPKPEEILEQLQK